ncbi:MAG TPA: hypothetical protein HPP64_00045 [Gammaproteobacteria bacterium]|nr:hypothetical protein [Gammaproteobacteria bacterium]MBT7326953.1 hypothetical protein [Gammaproteobacteria bacterium]HIJ21287.1 hypothetical protein [Gammaproteobacteria bacterium]
MAARCGGEKFAIILPNTISSKALTVIDQGLYAEKERAGNHSSIYPQRGIGLRNP